MAAGAVLRGGGEEQRATHPQSEVWLPNEIFGQCKWTHGMNI